MKSDSTTSYITETIRVGSATVCIHRPILTERERTKAEEDLVTAMRLYGKSMIGEKKQ